MSVAGSGPLEVPSRNRTCAELASLRRHDTMSPATVEQARSLGGTVVKGLDEHAERRHVRVLSDPAGSEIGAYTSPDEPGPEGSPKRGEFSWQSLRRLTIAPPSSLYSALFGWERVEEHDMGRCGVYFIFGRDGAQKMEC